MGPVKQLEAKLGDVYKSAPPLPENGKKWLVKYWPILALVFGALQILAFLGLWRNGHNLNDAVNTLNTYAKAYGVKTQASTLGFTYWLSLISLAISGVLLLLAYPGLKAKKKSGWDWLFLGALVNVAYGLVAAFSDYGGYGKLFGAVVGSAIAFYLLYQVRSHYTDHHTKKS